MLEQLKSHLLSTRSRLLAPISRGFLAAALASAVLNINMVPAARAEEGLKFKFSSNPNDAVFIIGAYGANTGIEVTTTLYGDGRLEFRTKASHGAVHEKKEMHVAHLEMEQFLRIAIDHGLAEASSDDVENKIRSLRPRGDLPLETDGGYVTMTISLTNYTRDGRDYGAVTNDITLFSPTILSRSYDIKELHGLVALLRRVSELKRRAGQRVE